MDCQACHKAGVTGLLCEGCGAIQPPAAERTHFQALGVPARFALDITELEGRHRELSRKLHPDRFAKAAPRERMLSLQAATTLNDAYRLLREPLARAAYLLALAGTRLDENDKVDQAFLMEMLELREELAEHKGAGDTRALAALGERIRARYDAALTAMRERFAEHERTRDAALLPLIKDRLVELRYFKRFLDEHEAGQDDA